jgi:mono/diheme cytochrome c family protein
LRPASAVVAALAAVALALAAWIFLELGRAKNPEAAALTGGHPERAADEMIRYGCGGCHTIPGVPGASGLVGPPLRSIGRLTYIGGSVRNTPDNLVRWILDPRGLNPKTRMPGTGISEPEARDIAAYLYLH